MNKKLYIHIGSHKTGTTSIQQALFSNKELLNTVNLSYFCKKPNGHNHHNMNVWFDNSPLPFVNGKISMKKNIDKLAYEMSKFPNDVILSGEAFSYFFDENELLIIKEALSKYFSEIKIIVYIRRQDKQAISHHNQAANLYLAPSHILYGDNPYVFKNKNELVENYLNYFKKLNIWSDIFGKDNIDIRIFEKSFLYRDDVVSDFFYKLGINEFKSLPYTNESRGLEKVKIGFLMNQTKINNGPLRNIINQNLNTKNKFLPKKEEAKKFYEQYRQSNIELNKMFNISEKYEAIFDEDFSMYPEEGNELWSEEGVNETITTIFKNLNNTYGKIDYNLLFQAATKLEKTDLKLSFEIIKMLNNIIPNNKIIYKKIENYNSFLKSLKK